MSTRCDYIGNSVHLQMGVDISCRRCHESVDMGRLFENAFGSWVGVFLGIRFSDSNVLSCCTVSILFIYRIYITISVQRENEAQFNTPWMSAVAKKVQSRD
jgi:hypothetical protein